MSGEELRLKSFINVSKLIQGLNASNDTTRIRIGFDDVFNVKGKGTSCQGQSPYTKETNIKVLSVKAMNNSQVLKNYDMLEIFKIADGINVWLNVRKQLNKINFGLTKKLHCIDIDLEQKTFTNQKGEKISYYPIHYISVKEGEQATRLMNKLEKELREKEVQYVDSLAKKVYEKDEENEKEISPDMI